MRSTFQNFFLSFSIFIGVYLILFVLFNVLGFKPSYLLMGQRTDAKTVAAIEQKYHLNWTAPHRLVSSLNDLMPLGIYSKENNAFLPLDSEDLHGVALLPLPKNYHLYLKFPYLGRSFQNHETVAKLVAQHFLPTLVLALCAIVFATFFGMILGIMAALKKGTFWEQWILNFSSLWISAPSFFVAMILALVFGYYLSDWTGLHFQGSLIEMNDIGDRVFRWKNLILPTIALGMRPVAIIIQLTRNSLLDVLGEDYIRTARAKGLSEKTVVVKHALQNALNPVITSIASWFGGMLGGSYFIEMIFGYKGLGNLTVNALMKFDIPVVLGASLLVSLLYIGLSFGVDWLYAKIDPRVKN